MGNPAGTQDKPTFIERSTPGVGPDFGLINPDEQAGMSPLRQLLGRQYFGGGGGGRVPEVATPVQPDNPLQNQPPYNDFAMNHSPMDTPYAPYPAAGSLHKFEPHGTDQHIGFKMQAPGVTGSQGQPPASVPMPGNTNGLPMPPTRPGNDNIAPIKASYDPAANPANAKADAIFANTPGRQAAGAQIAIAPSNPTGSSANASGGAADPHGSPSMSMIRQSIKDIESGGGNYRAVGKRTRTGDRAYGAYQVMGNNIGPWTQQVLGRRLSIQEFIANPAVQDKVFDTIFGEAIQAHGLAGAASTWFTGSPTPTGAKDANQMDDHTYVQRFMQGLGQPLRNVNNQTPGTGDASVMESMQPGVSNATGGGNDTLTPHPNPSDADVAQNGGSGLAVNKEQEQAQQLDQLRRMSLKERLAVLQQFMQLGGFKPGEGAVG